MIRKVKRSKAYELSLEIRQEDFIKTPREDQRQWLLNRMIKEAADEIERADVLARSLRHW